MAHLHLGGRSAPDSGVMLCPFCHEAGQEIGVPCWRCGASVDQSVLDFPEEEHLVRPLSDGSDMSRAELQDREEQHVVTGSQLAIEDVYEACGR
eukprot:7231703-Alexandrium_andersonii.AAC.1